VGGEALWLDRRLEEKHATAITDDQGCFAIQGLCQAEYDLRVEIPGLSMPPQLFKVNVPDVAFAIDLRLGAVQVDLDWSGPLTWASFTVRAGSHERVARDGQTMLVPPDAWLEVTISFLPMPPGAAKSCEDAENHVQSLTRELRGPAPGQLLRLSWRPGSPLQEDIVAMPAVAGGR
jgi:hypothetical protein